jgi:uncharacterized protein YcfJ
MVARAAAADGGSYFDFARVLQVDPIHEVVSVPVKQERCRQSSGARRADETMAGDVRSAEFSISIGEAIDEEIRHRERTADMRRCRLVTSYEKRNRIVAFRVHYAYDGNVFVRRMNDHPGKRLRVRVSLHH